MHPTLISSTYRFPLTVEAHKRLLDLEYEYTISAIEPVTELLPSPFLAIKALRNVVAIGWVIKPVNGLASHLPAVDVVIEGNDPKTIILVEHLLKGFTEDNTNG